MDIIIIAVLCVINARVAKSRGRRPGGFVALTLVLTWGLMMVFVGFVLVRTLPGLIESGTLTPENVTSVVMGELSRPLVISTYAALAIGGVTSFLLTRNCRRGDEMPQQNPAGNGSYYGAPMGGQGGAYSGNGMYGSPMNGQGMYGNQAGARPMFGGPTPGQSGMYQGTYGQPQMQYGMNMMQGMDVQAGELLANPCTVCIIREPSAGAANDIYTFSLNGHPICQLGNGAYANIMTNVIHNTVTARDGAGVSLKKPVQFVAASGGYVEIHAKGGQFLPEKTVGRRPADSMPPVEEQQEQMSNIDQL